MTTTAITKTMTLTSSATPTMTMMLLISSHFTTKLRQAMICASNDTNKRLQPKHQKNFKTWCQTTRPEFLMQLKKKAKKP